METHGIYKEGLFGSCPGPLLYMFARKPQSPVIQLRISQKRIRNKKTARLSGRETIVNGTTTTRLKIHSKCASPSEASPTEDPAEALKSVPVVLGIKN